MNVATINVTFNVIYKLIDAPTRRTPVTVSGETSFLVSILIYVLILAKTVTLTIIYNNNYIHEKSTKQPHQSQGSATELHLDAGAYTSYGLNTAPSSLIGSKCVDVKGETSHPALSIFL